MELTNIKDLFREKEKYQGRKVTVGGWVRSNRDSKNFGFLVVNDGTFLSRFRSYTAVKCRVCGSSQNGVGAAGCGDRYDCRDTRGKAAYRNAG